jgi:spore coat protein A
MSIDRRRFLISAGAMSSMPWACRREPAPPPPTPAPVRAPLHVESLARFVDPLPIPAIKQPDGTRPDPHDARRQIPFYRVAMREARVRVHRDVPATSFWTYDGSMPGPTFETRAGQPLLVEWHNDLPARHFLPIDHTLCGAGRDRPDVRAIVHVHGAKVPPDSDGYPEHWYVPGQSKTFYYPNAQDAATLWYHDHAMGIERLDQYAGLFGAYLVRDAAEDALGLPGGAYDIPLFVFDRYLDVDGHHMDETHPIHLHLVRFQVLERQRYDADLYARERKLKLLGAAVLPEPHDVGWKDTVQVPPEVITRIIVRFEGYAGRDVWHCHVLEHAANEMMRPFEVVRSGKR